VAAVILTGNHYLVDVVAGLALALIGLWAAQELDRRRPGHARPPGPTHGRSR
jgi:membrane-associated phospholipid phosphatase